MFGWIQTMAELAFLGDLVNGALYAKSAFSGTVTSGKWLDIVQVPRFEEANKAHKSCPNAHTSHVSTGFYIADYELNGGTLTLIQCIVT